MISNKIIKKFKNKFKNFTRDHLIAYSYDASNLEFLPDGIFYPKNSKELADFVKLCYKYKIPIYPRGGGTSMTGAPLAYYNGFVVSFEKMRKIISIDEKSNIAIVEPGVFTANLQRECNKKNLFYPPDPASSNVSTIGGNVSTNAGGLRGLKYGTTRNYVLGLEIVDGYGNIYEFGNYALRYASGYPLHLLMCGAEGTLGLITKVILRLLPYYGKNLTLYAGFDNWQSLLDFLFRVVKKALPEILEFLDPLCVNALNLRKKTNISGKYFLLIQYRELSKKGLDYLLKEILNIHKNIIYTYNNHELFLEWRRGLMAEFTKIRPNILSEDIVLPLKNLHKFFDIFFKHKFKLPISLFGHIGDGNLHPTTLYDIKKEKILSEELKSFIYNLTLDCKGSIFAEHGVGKEKKEIFNKIIPKYSINFMKDIKKSFDPLNILNPGTLFEYSSKNNDECL